MTDDPTAKPSTSLIAFTPVPRKRMRRGGWSAERQREFIEHLADTGSVRAACRRMGVGEHHIYKLRRHPEGESFARAWEAALDHGIARIEDVAMDRALNGVEQPVYHKGEIVGTRQVYNDRLLMFMLRNRASDRFAEGKARAADAIDRMDEKRLKKKWRKEWEKEREAEQPARRLKSTADARAIIDTKLEELRNRVIARHAVQWRRLSPETRQAYRRFEELKSRDLNCPLEMPDYAISEEEIAAEEAREQTLQGETHNAPDGTPQLPPPGWLERDKREEEPEDGPRIRTVRDEGW